MPDNNQAHQDEALEAPSNLVAALQRLPPGPVCIPPTTDEAILRAAQRHLAALATGAEGVQPRVEPAPTSSARRVIPGLQWLRTLLRPRPGALRWFGQAATGRARFLPWAVAGAAVVVVLIEIPQFFNQPASSQARDASFVRGDLNHDRHVDILDAFALARQLKQGGPGNLPLDVNGDGVVDERDVEALVVRAVKLEPAGHS